MGENETIREKSTWNLNEPLNNNLTVLLVKKTTQVLSVFMNLSYQLF